MNEINKTLDVQLAQFPGVTEFVDAKADEMAQIVRARNGDYISQIAWEYLEAAKELG